MDTKRLYISDYKSRLQSLHLLPLMMTLELYDISFFLNLFLLLRMPLMFLNTFLLVGGSNICLLLNVQNNYAIYKNRKKGK